MRSLSIASARRESIQHSAFWQLRTSPIMLHSLSPEPAVPSAVWHDS